MNLSARRQQLINSLVGLVCLLTAGAAVLLLLALVAFMLHESWPVWTAMGLKGTLLSTVWNPVASTPQLGIGSMLVSTLWAALGALLLSVPLGLCAAIFLAEFAPPWLAAVIRPALNMLAGIPSVVYGFLGAAVLVKAFEVSFNMASGESLFCASVVLTVMVLPYIVANSEAALRAVPAAYRHTALALGVSRSYLALRVLVPAAKKGLVGALVLAFGRAAGETMAVLMVAGNVVTMPSGWFSKGEPLPALIALEIGTAEVGSLHYQGLFAAGLVFLVFLIVLNLFFGLLRGGRWNGGGE